MEFRLLEVMDVHVCESQDLQYFIKDLPLHRYCSKTEEDGQTHYKYVWGRSSTSIVCIIRSFSKGKDSEFKEFKTSGQVVIYDYTKKYSRITMYDNFTDGYDALKNLLDKSLLLESKL